MPGSEKLQPGEDGRFHCTRPGCEDVSYDLAQHLGLHLYHKHGVAGKSRQPRPKRMPSKALAVVKKRRSQPDMTPDAVCLTVLVELAPDGAIPIDALPAYTRWLAATVEMMEALE